MLSQGTASTEELINDDDDKEKVLSKEKVEFWAKQDPDGSKKKAAEKLKAAELKKAKEQKLNKEMEALSTAEALKLKHKALKEAQDQLKREAD